MSVYYNEIDPYAAEWLRRLMIEGIIPWGDVDERSIRDVSADDLKGYAQCHFFAGIGVWSQALRRCGWDDDRQVWTGSCPCQPFSAAGQRKGFQDERHLWPTWFSLIAQRRPPVVLGEQVASKDGLRWLDTVSADVEGEGYAIGASDLCAAGFGQAHIRQRLYFAAVADTNDERSQGQHQRRDRADQRLAGAGGVVGGLADTLPAGRPERRTGAGCGPATGGGSAGRLANAGRAGNECVLDGGDAASAAGQDESEAQQLQRSGLADAERAQRGPEAERGNVGYREDPGRQETPSGDGERSDLGGLEHASSRDASAERQQCCRQHRQQQAHQSGSRPALCDKGEIAVSERWFALDWLLCRNPAGEPSWRPVEPGTFPLANGVANRTSQLRACGNALDLETAAGFVGAVMECL